MPQCHNTADKAEITMMIGSTEKAGTGLNVQQNVIAMHHLDIPWKPSELEQRNGRGARQGNKLAKSDYSNKVQNFIYAVEQSLDNYKFNLLKNKQTFISQMKNCELNVRTIDEGSIDEKSGMNFSEYIAILSGDTTLLEKTKLEKKIAAMESLKVAHYRESSRAKFTLDTIRREKENTERMISRLSGDEAVYKSQLTYDKDGAKMNPIQLDGLSTEKPEETGRHLIHLSKHWKPEKGETGIQKIGTLYGFDLMIQRHTELMEGVKGAHLLSGYNTLFAVRPGSDIKYQYSSGVPNPDNPKLAARYYLNAIDRVEPLLEKYRKELREAAENIPKLESLIGRPFEKEAELQQMKSELSGLERQIALNIQQKQMEDAQQKIALNESKEAVIVQLPDERQTTGITGSQVAANGSHMQEESLPLKKSKGLKIS